MSSLYRSQPGAGVLEKPGKDTARRPAIPPACVSMPHRALYAYAKHHRKGAAVGVAKQQANTAIYDLMMICESD